jgi:hypothetical protein
MGVRTSYVPNTGDGPRFETPSLLANRR